MSAPIDTLVTVFGGSGFLGRHVVRALAKRDYRIRVGVRRPELAGYLQPLGRVGQIHTVQANLRHPASVAAAMRDSHVAINLVGIAAKPGKIAWLIASPSMLILRSTRKLPTSAAETAHSIPATTIQPSSAQFQCSRRFIAVGPITHSLDWREWDADSLEYHLHRRAAE